MGVDVWVLALIVSDALKVFSHVTDNCLLWLSYFPYSPPGGTVHREIFSFSRIEGNQFKAREWDDLVRPVIKKWGRFVKEHM